MAMPTKIPYEQIRKGIMERPAGQWRTKQLRMLNSMQKARLPQRAEIRINPNYPVKAVLECAGKRTIGHATTEPSSYAYYEATAIRSIIDRTPWLMKQYMGGLIGTVYAYYGQVPNRIEIIPTTPREIMSYLSDQYEISTYKDKGIKVYLLNKR